MIAIYLGLTVGVFLLFMLVLRADWTPGRYKVIYYVGPTVSLKTKMLSGWLSVAAGQINITGEKELSVPLSSVRSVERFRLHGMGRMIRLVRDQDTLFVTVVRFSIAGRFATIDFFKTGKLAKHVTSLITSETTSS